MIAVFFASGPNIGQSSAAVSVRDLQPLSGLSDAEILTLRSNDEILLDAKFSIKRLPERPTLTEGRVAAEAEVAPSVKRRHFPQHNLA